MAAQLAQGCTVGGADSGEPEVTPRMAAAGLAVLSKIYDRYEVLEADSVARIHQAMRKAAPRWHTSY
jgi:hypothetical protein